MSPSKYQDNNEIDIEPSMASPRSLTKEKSVYNPMRTLQKNLRMKVSVIELFQIQDSELALVNAVSSSSRLLNKDVCHPIDNSDCDLPIVVGRVIRV